MTNLLNSLITLFNYNEPKISPHQFKTLRYNDCCQLIYDVTTKLGLKPSFNLVTNQSEIRIAYGSQITCGIYDKDNSIFTINIYDSYAKLLEYKQKLDFGAIILLDHFGIELVITLVEFTLSDSQLTITQSIGKTSDINRILYDTLKLIK
jgi:hypothetical protein